MKYKCVYSSGGGREYNNLIWTRKDTPKTITLEAIEGIGADVFANHKLGQKIRVGKGTGNPLREHGDGTFTVYFNRAGIPYYFEPLGDN
jgi:hypothetical protein